MTSLIVGYYHCETEDCSDPGEFQELGHTENGGTIAATIGTHGQPVFAWIDSAGMHTASCNARTVNGNSFEPDFETRAASLPGE